MNREPVGEITCPLCKRDAELHQFAERQKLNPDSEGGGKPTYPKKFFVICPPVRGYRGCGTILANGAEAQLRLMDLGRVFGASKDSPKGAVSVVKPQGTEETGSDRPAAPALATTPAAAKPVAGAARNPFKLW